MVRTMFIIFSLIQANGFWFLLFTFTGLFRLFPFPSSVSPSMFVRASSFVDVRSASNTQISSESITFKDESHRCASIFYSLSSLSLSSYQLKGQLQQKQQQQEQKNKNMVLSTTSFIKEKSDSTSVDSFGHDKVPPLVISQYNCSIKMNLNGAIGEGKLYADSTIRRSLQVIDHGQYQITTFMSDTSDEGKENQK